MPINGVADLQRRSLPLGEIRIGTSKPVPGKNYRQPVRLDTFRFTTGSEAIAVVVAAKYGGTVAPWTQRRGTWEVITDRAALDVWVPARGTPVDSYMELWDGPRRLRRCDGLIEQLSGNGRGAPCMCPQPDDPDDPVSVQATREERKRLAGLRPPQACKPLTRISVTIPDLPGMTGTFRLNTGSENAAVETADSGEAMDIAREGGVYLPAVLRISWRVRAADGSPYPVPVLQIGLSMRQIADAALPAGSTGLIAQLKGAAEPRALTAGTTTTTDGDGDGEVPPPAEPPGPGDDAGPGGFLAGDEDAAQRIADLATLAATRDDINNLRARCSAEQIPADAFVCTDRQNDTVEPLIEYLRDRYRELPAGEPA